jgi:hypothetical protein
MFDGQFSGQMDEFLPGEHHAPSGELKLLFQ